jgi:ABC-2 type transport system permease protein
VRPLTAQLRAELLMLFTNGETVFLTLGIPVVFLLFFSGVHVLPTGTKHPVNFLVPGILALAVMSTAMTALGIGTGFERGYGVLKRLGTTPLGRPRLLAAKITAITAVELIQAGVLIAVGFARDGIREDRPAPARRWVEPSGPWSSAPSPSEVLACCWPGR